MIARRDRRSSVFDRLPPREPASHVLSDLTQTTAAWHASLLRWDPGAASLTVASVAGAPVVAPGMVLPADDVDAVVLEDDRAIPLTLPVLALLAGASGIEDTFAAALRDDDGAVQALLFICWMDAASAPSDGKLLAAVEQHRPRLDAVLRAASSAPIVVAHEDELAAHGIARIVEGRYISPVLTCLTPADLRRTLETGAASVVLVSDRLASDTPLAALVDTVRDRARGARVVVLTRAETAAGIAATRAAHVDGLASLADGVGHVLQVLDAVRQGKTVLPSASSRPTDRP